MLFETNFILFLIIGAKILTNVIANDESIQSAVAVRDEDGDL